MGARETRDSYLRMTGPMSGAFKMNLSNNARPRFVRMPAGKPNTSAAMVPMMITQWSTKAFDMLTTCVGFGSAPPPKSLNIASKTGMTFHNRPTTRMATPIEIG